MRYHKALINIKHTLAPCQIMVIMTHFHNTPQYRHDPWPDFAHILYSDEARWSLDAHEIDFGFAPRCSNYGHFYFSLTSFCSISKTYGPILLIFGTVMRYFFINFWHVIDGSSFLRILHDCEHMYTCTPIIDRKTTLAVCQNFQEVIVD